MKNIIVSAEEKLTADEQQVINVYRRTKSIMFADIQITIADGERVRLWFTEKIK